MKQILTCAFVLCTLISNSQTFDGDLPNYLLAHNANPLVLVISYHDIGVDVEVGEVAQAPASLSSDLTSSNGVYQNMIFTLDEALKNTGILPQGYMHVGWNEVSNPKRLADLIDANCDYEPYYSISTTISDWDGIMKKAKKAKGEFTLEIIDGPDLIFTKLGATSTADMYKSIESKFNMKERFEVLSNTIKSQEESFFVSKVNLDDVAAGVSTPAEKWTDETINAECTEIILDWPSIEDLESSRTIIWCEDNSPKNRDRHIGVEDMAEGFKYAYDFPEEGKFYEHFGTDYKYILNPILIQYEYDKTTSREYQAMGTGINRTDSKTETVQRSRYYYVLQEIATGKCYVGPDEKKLRNTARFNQPEAIAGFLKQFNKE